MNSSTDETEKERDDGQRDTLQPNTKQPKNELQSSAVEESASEEEDDKNDYPHGFKLVTLTVALMFATFMVALDTNVIGEDMLFSFFHTTLRAPLSHSPGC